MGTNESLRAFQEAQALFHQGRYAESLSLLDTLNRAIPGHKDILYLRALCLSRLGKISEAGLICDHLSSVLNDPRGTALKQELGKDLFAEGESPQKESGTAPVFQAPAESRRRGPIRRFLHAISAAITAIFLLPKKVFGKALTKPGPQAPGSTGIPPHSVPGAETFSSPISSPSELLTQPQGVPPQTIPSPEAITGFSPQGYDHASSTMAQTMSQKGTAHAVKHSTQRKSVYRLLLGTRKRKMFCIALLAALLILLWSLHLRGGAPMISDWPMGGHDASRTNSNSQEKTLYPPLKEVWAAYVPGEVEFITVAGDTVLAAVGGEANRVMAYAAPNGGLHWESEPFGVGAIGCAAAVEGNITVFSGQGGDTLYAINMTSYESTWNYKGVANLYCRPPCIYNGTVFLTTAAEYSVALNIRDASEKWRRDIATVTGTSPVLGGGREYLATKDGIVALDLTSGKTLWQKEGISSVYLNIIYSDEHLYIAVPDSTDLFALDATTGKEIWKSQIKAEIARFPIGTALWKSILFIPCWKNANGKGQITAVSTESGNVIWEFEDTAQGMRAPVAANGILYTISKQMLTALEAGTGKVQWQIKNGGCSLAVANGTLYVGGSGSIHALRPGQPVSDTLTRPQIPERYLAQQNKTENKPAPQPCTLPGNISTGVRPMPSGSPVLSAPDFKMDSFHSDFEKKGMVLEVKSMTATPPISKEGVIEIAQGAEFTIGLEVVYKTDAATKLAASIKPDIEEVMQCGNERGLHDLYGNTAHFDTQSRAGYQDVQGEGTISFTLTSWAPTAVGRNEKEVMIGLFDHQTWATICIKNFPLILNVVEKKPEIAVANPIDAGPRTLIFPSNVIVGSLRIRPLGSTDVREWQRLNDAMGTIAVPAGKEVRLNCSSPSLDFLDKLKPNDLNAISLDNSGVTDEMLTHIIPLKGLHTLNISQTKISSSGVAQLKKALPACTIIGSGR